MSSARDRLELVGERLDVPRAAEWVRRVRRARLVHEDLLRAEREGRGALGRERERLVEAVRVDRLGAAVDRREGLRGDSHEVVLGLLGRQRRAARLRVEAQRLRLRARGAEAVAHDPRPHSPRGAELRHLLQHVVVGVEEEGEPRPEGVGRETRGDGRLAVGDPVRERERELLGRRRPRLPDVVAGDRDRVPARDPLGAVREQVGRQPHRRAGREDVVPARDVLLEDVVLHRPAEGVAGDAALLGHQLVAEQQERCGRVDRHRGRDLVEGDARRGGEPCRRPSRSRRRFGPPRPPPPGRPSRSPAGSAGRRRPRAPSDPARAASGTARSSPPPSRTRRTGASSTAGRGTCPRTGRA